MSHIILSLFLILHGLVHLLWFVVPWGIMQVDGLPYATTVIAGRVDVGERGIRFVGLLWALGMIAFALAGIGLLLSTSWSLPMTAAAVAYSMFLCLLGWPDTRWAVVINAIITALLIIAF